MNPQRFLNRLACVCRLHVKTQSVAPGGEVLYVERVDDMLRGIRHLQTHRTKYIVQVEVRLQVASVAVVVVDAHLPEPLLHVRGGDEAPVCFVVGLCVFGDESPDLDGAGRRFGSRGDMAGGG